MRMWFVSTAVDECEFSIALCCSGWQPQAALPEVGDFAQLPLGCVRASREHRLQGAGPFGPHRLQPGLFPVWRRTSRYAVHQLPEPTGCGEGASQTPLLAGRFAARAHRPASSARETVCQPLTRTQESSVVPVVRTCAAHQRLSAWNLMGARPPSQVTQKPSKPANAGDAFSSRPFLSRHVIGDGICR